MAIVGAKVVGVQELKDVGTIVAIVGVGLLGFRGLMMSKASNQERSTGPQSKVDRTAGLPPPSLHAEPPTVTETTTRQLDALVARTKEDQRDTNPQ